MKEVDLAISDICGIVNLFIEVGIIAELERGNIL
jgi:hypothetical protein